MWHSKHFSVPCVLHRFVSIEEELNYLYKRNIPMSHQSCAYIINVKVDGISLACMSASTTLPETILHPLLRLHAFDQSFSNGQYYP
jgi:hypothetical protein